MIAYFAVAAVLALCALVERDTIEPFKPSAIVAASVLTLFAGLRFETGYDWMEYEAYFYSLGTFTDASATLEPGFGLLAGTMRKAGLSFELFQLVIAALNMAALYFLAVRFTGRPALVLAVYFGLTFLGGQMAAIRQTTAYAFTFLAVLALSDGKAARSVILNVVSAGTHSFSIVTAPLMYLRVRLPPPLALVVMAAAGLAATVSGLQLWLLLTETVSPILPDFLAARLRFYSYEAVVQVSPFSLLLTVWHLFCFWAIYRKEPRPQDWPVIRFTLWLIALTVFAHTWMASFPGVWNRLMLMAIPLEVILLTRAYRGVFALPSARFSLVGGGVAASLVALLLQLNRPEMLPYTPYQFAPYHWITGAPSDGRLRYKIQMQRSYEEIQRQRG